MWKTLEELFPPQPRGPHQLVDGAICGPFTHLEKQGPLLSREAQDPGASCEAAPDDRSCCG